MMAALYELEDLLPYLLWKHPTHTGFILNRISILVSEYVGNNSLVYYHTYSDRTTVGYGQCFADFDCNKSLYIIYSYKKARLPVSKLSRIKNYVNKKMKASSDDNDGYNDSLSIDTKTKAMNAMKFAPDFISIFTSDKSVNDRMVYSVNQVIYSSLIRQQDSQDVIHKHNNKNIKIIAWWKQFKNYKENKYCVYYMYNDKQSKQLVLNKIVSAKTCVVKKLFAIPCDKKNQLFIVQNNCCYYHELLNILILAKQNKKGRIWIHLISKRKPNNVVKVAVPKAGKIEWSEYCLSHLFYNKYFVMNMMHKSNDKLSEIEPMSYGGLRPMNIRHKRNKCDHWIRIAIDLQKSKITMLHISESTVDEGRIIAYDDYLSMLVYDTERQNAEGDNMLLYTRRRMRMPGGIDTQARVKQQLYTVRLRDVTKRWIKCKIC